MCIGVGGWGGGGGGGGGGDVAVKLFDSSHLAPNSFTS